MAWNDDLTWYQTGEVADGCDPASPGPVGGLNRPVAQLLENDLELKGWLEQEHDAGGYHNLLASARILQLGFDAATQIDIAADTITVAGSNHIVVPETGLSDNLQQIDGGIAGHFLMLHTLLDTHTITIKHGVGNVLVSSGDDVVLSSTRQWAMLLFDTPYWRLNDFTGGNSTGLKLHHLTGPGSLPVTPNSSASLALPSGGGTHRFYQLSTYCSSHPSVPVHQAGTIFDPTTDTHDGTMITAHIMQYGTGTNDKLVVYNFTDNSITVDYDVYAWEM